MRILLCLFPLALITCNNPLHHEKHRFYHMDTMIDITVATVKSGAVMEPVWSTIDSFLADWDARYSDSGALSEVEAVNRRTSSAVRIAPRLGGMIADAIGYGDTTGGSYDITILPLKDLWGLGYLERKEVVPPADSIAAAVARIGYRHVRVGTARDTVFIDDPGIVIDAGGFAKGYALVAIGTILQSKGFGDYLIAAGDIIARGRRFNGAPWVIGIQHPRRPGRLLATTPLDGGAIFTSGDYERRWQSDPLVHHIFNPYTGRSCTRNQSLTIWSPDPLQAKYLSTGLFGWRADSILAFTSRRNLKTVIVDSAGSVIISQNWAKEIALEKE